jgi:hypothetical protein
MREKDLTAGNGSADRNEGAVLAEGLRALRSIEYGSVLINLHQGQVVAIETSTKVRIKGT